jgi:hypothetical protein
MGWGPEQATVHMVPHLTTSGFDFAVIAQRGLRSSGELYAVTDGERVLPGRPETLGEVLAAEGLPADPGALPPAQAAELALRLLAPGRGHLVTGVDDPALRGADRVSPSAVEPQVTREGDAARIDFLSARGPHGPVERWSVGVHADGSIHTHVEDAR